MLSRLTLENRGPNCHVLSDGTTHILFSYRTPVAACRDGQGFVRVNSSPSPTTSRHISAWLGNATARGVSQRDLYAVFLSDGARHLWRRREEVPENNLPALEALRDLIDVASTESAPVHIRDQAAKARKVLNA